MATTEATIQPEALSPAEFGERTHSVITELVTNLLAIPEFNLATARTFFGRSFDRGGRAEIADGVHFERNGYGYMVRWHAEPLRFGPEFVGEYDARFRLEIIKLDLNIKRAEERGTEKVSDLSLSTHLIENQDGIVKEYKEGWAKVEEDFRIMSPHVFTADPATTFSGKEALDRIPQTFRDLFPSPVKL